MKTIISNNQYVYFINSSNNNILTDFDEFIFNTLERHEKNKENKYSNYLYERLKEHILFL